MYCQKCRTPLKLDPSLDNLNPAAFELLVGSTGKTFPDPTTNENPNYPRERKDLYNRVAANTTSPVHKRTIPAPRHEHPPAYGLPDEGRPDMSFIEITQSQIVPTPQTPDQKSLSFRSRHPKESQTHVDDDNVNDQQNTPLSWDVQRYERLFSILSSHSDIDHPICKECTSLLLSSLTARLTASVRERDAYSSFLKTLQSSSVNPSADDGEVADRELAQTLEAERKSLEELEALEAEKRALEAEIAELETQSSSLELEEEAFWASRNAFDEELHDLTTDLTSLQQRYAHDQQELERLQRTNVYNDTFCIGHDGYFGTINGLRLGRLPSQNVEWAEINAAWGQTVLLLATIAERLGFTFQGYRLRPLGSTSRIDKIEWPQQPPESPSRANINTAVTNAASTAATPKITTLDLFGSGDMPLGRMLSHRRFDNGMVAFLDCLAQLGQHVEKSAYLADGRPGLPKKPSSRNSAARNLVLPYSIQGDKIGDPETGQAVSIKLGAGYLQDESWAKACKYTLTCCKFLLAHISNLSNVKEPTAAA